MPRDAISIEVESGLTSRYHSLMEVVRSTVRRAEKPRKAIAAEMGLSESALSRKLSGARGLSIDEFERLLAVTGDPRPIHWLIEQCVESADTRRDRALIEIQRQLPAFMALLKTLTADQP